MKIAYIAASTIPSRTANSVHVMKMCQAYARLGHDVTLIVPEAQQDSEKNVEDIYRFYGVERSFEIVQLRSFGPKTFWYSAALPFSAMRHVRADWYHTRIDLAALGLTRVLQQKTILEIHDLPKPGRGRPQRLRYLSGSRKLLGVVAITSALEQRLRPCLATSTKTIVAADGCDSMLVNSNLTQNDARKHLGISLQSPPLIVYTGHLYPGRGVELIVELAKRHQDYHFLLVGGRDEDIEGWRKSTQDIQNLQFAGFVPPAEVFSYLRAADILLMPYAHQVAHAGGGDTASICSPMKMFEYLAAGRPMIASDLPVLQEVLQPNHNCLIAPYGNIEAWSAGLVRLAEDPAQASRIGFQALEDVRGYTWESRASRLCDFVCSG